MKTKELADWLGLSPATIRLWSLENEYGGYLSPASMGGDGRMRYFTDIDSRILAHVASLKMQGFTRDEINAALQQLQKTDWADLPPMPGAPPNHGPVRMVPQSTAETAVSAQRTSFAREITILRERVEDLEHELMAQRDRSEAKQEALLRELADMKMQLAEAQVELRLYRQGRLKPDDV
jgi:DNA-binding transcriptional MerR regulator